MELRRMSAAGNVFYIRLAAAPADAAGLARAICAGWAREDGFNAPVADGLIFVDPGFVDPGAFVRPTRQRMFNPDGSEGMCANGLRCVAWLLDNMVSRAGSLVPPAGHMDQRTGDLRTRTGDEAPRAVSESRDGGSTSSYLIETIAGAKLVLVDGNNVEARLGGATPLPGREAAGFGPFDLELTGETLTGFGVFVGNPHFVIFADTVMQARVKELGPALNRHPAFPDGVNVEIAAAQSCEEGKLFTVRVWERGVGETLSCGTGALAVASAAAIAGRETCRLRYPGGELRVRRDEAGGLHLSGELRDEGIYEFSVLGAAKNSEQTGGSA